MRPATISRIKVHALPVNTIRYGTMTPMGASRLIMFGSIFSDELRFETSLVEARVAH